MGNSHDRRTLRRMVEDAITDVISRQTASSAMEKMPNSKPIDRWLTLGFGIVSILLYLLEKTPPVIIGCLASMFALSAHPLWNFWWIEKTTIRRAVALLGMSVVLIGVGIISWPRPIVAAVPSFQVEAVRDVEHFVVGQDFGFPEMLAINVKMVTDKIVYFRKTGRKNFDITPYTRGRQMLFDPRIVGGDVHRQGGGFVFDPAPNYVALIALPEKYSTSKDILRKFETSGELPTSVIDSVKELDGAVTDNASTLLKVLNDAFQESPEYYLEYENSNSSYFHLIDERYSQRDIQLGPKDDKILDSIRKFLNVK